jgi:hypothetical protein
MEAIKDFFGSLMLRVDKGLALTGRYVCPQNYCPISRRKNAAVTTFPWFACFASLSKREERCIAVNCVKRCAGDGDYD